MNELIFIIFISAGIVGLLGYIGFLFALGQKIDRLEQKIRYLFFERTNLVPSIFEVSKGHLTKHDDIFKEIIILRKKEFHAKENHIPFGEFIQTESNIHHELNFVFRVCNEHNRLLKNGKFLYVRDILIEKSMDISEKMILYKSIIKKYSHYTKISKWLLIGLIIPPKKIQEL